MQRLMVMWSHLCSENHKTPPLCRLQCHGGTMVDIDEAHGVRLAEWSRMCNPHGAVEAFDEPATPEEPQLVVVAAAI